MNDEIWLPVVGYEGWYEVSSLGRTRSVTRSVRSHSGGFQIKKGMILSPILTTGECGGYLLISLTKNGERHGTGVHRLVAKAFIPNPENKPQVNHKNSIRNDNRVENLEWVTASENIRHGYARGTWVKDKRYGEDNARSKITNAQRREIISRSAQETHDSLAREFGLHQSTISRFLKFKTARYLVSSS